jgi:hypothetical protein
MAHQHKGHNQQAHKWERFKQRYGMTPVEWRELKKSDPAKAHKVRMEADIRYRNSIKTVKTKDI